jgi:hypothetical protein
MDAASLRQAQLVVLEGEATKKAYTLSGERTNVGRLAEVSDKHRRVVRRNQVVFLDADTETNQTVSRAQAHIRLPRNFASSTTIAAMARESCATAG